MASRRKHFIGNEIASNTAAIAEGIDASAPPWDSILKALADVKWRDISPSISVKNMVMATSNRNEASMRAYRRARLRGESSRYQKTSASN